MTKINIIVVLLLLLLKRYFMIEVELDMNYMTD